MYRRAQRLPICLNGSSNGPPIQMEAGPEIIHSAIIVGVVVKPQHQQQHERVQIHLGVNGVVRLEWQSWANGIRQCRAGLPSFSHYPPIPCNTLMVKAADEIAATFNLIAPRGTPEKGLRDELLVVALNSANQATLPPTVVWRCRRLQHR
jgi:hypothetical protein